MSSEILAVLEYMEKEKGISREDMIATIEGAVKAAAERGVNKQEKSVLRSILKLVPCKLGLDWK